MRWPFNSGAWEPVRRRDSERGGGETRDSYGGGEDEVIRSIRWTFAVGLFALGVAAAAPADESTAEADWQAVQQVCGRCHTVDVFLNKPRAWERWNDVFADMTQRGATGTDEQLTRVTRFFLENLTLVNVNSSPADELKWVLGAPDDVMQTILARREHQPFKNLEELRGVAGLDGQVLEQRKSRISF